MAGEYKVQFSPQVKLAAAVHFSEHFDPGILLTLQDWAAGKPTSVHDFFIAMPAIATETFAHVTGTGDKRAAEVWREVGEQLSEQAGYAMTRERLRAK